MARELLASCGGGLPERVMDVLRKRKRQRSVQAAHLWQRLNTHPGSKTNAFFWMVATCLLLVSSRRNLGGGGVLFVSCGVKVSIS